MNNQFDNCVFELCRTFARNIGFFSENGLVSDSSSHRAHLRIRQFQLVNRHR